MVKNLREFKVGDVIQDTNNKERIYVVGEIEQTEKIVVYGIKGAMDKVIRVPRGNDIFVYSSLDVDNASPRDFRLVSKEIVEEYLLGDKEKECLSKALSKLNKL